MNQSDERTKKALRARILAAEKHKQELIRISQLLVRKVERREITPSEYHEQLSHYLQGKSLEEWITYYDDYIEACTQRLEHHSRTSTHKKISHTTRTLTQLAFVCIAFFGMLAIVIMYNSTITGFIAKEFSDGESFLVPDFSNQSSNQTSVEALNETIVPTDDSIPSSEENITSVNQTISPSGEEISDIEPEVDVVPVPLDVQTEQHLAVVGSPVQWTKTVSFNADFSLSESRVELPEGAFNVSLSNSLDSQSLSIVDNAVDLSSYAGSSEVVLTYYTEAPTLEAEITSYGKRVVVSGPSEVHYTNVAAFTEVDEIVSTSRAHTIRVYWREEARLVDFEALDLDGDGIIDGISWNVPHLSDQTFDIILVVKAEHLSANRTFISDIYSQVKEQDGIFSEDISDNHYVRVTFEYNLTQGRDITLYPRITSGRPEIEVYERDSNERIAHFSSLTNEAYNTIYLTNVPSAFSQDTFDLRVVGGTLQFDHIIDPTVTVSGNTTDVDLVAITNQTFGVVYVNQTDGSVLFRLVNITAGTTSAAFVVDNSSNSNLTRVSASPVNDTMFWIGYINATGARDFRTAFSPTGTRIIAKATGDGGVGNRGHDLKLTTMGRDRFAYCYIDATEDDVDIKVYNITTGAAIGAESDHNTAVGALENMTNKLDCVAINGTRGLVFEYDGAADDDATFHYFSENSTEVVTDTDIDTNVGDFAQVAVASMDNNRVAMFWYNTTSHLRMAIRTVNNTPVLAATTLFPVKVASTLANDTRLATATVRNLSTNLDNVVVVFKNVTNGSIMATAYNGSGTRVTAPFIIEQSPAPRTLIAALGQHDAHDSGLCAGTFVVAYTNATYSLVTKSYWLNGSIWDGVCGAVIQGGPIDTQAPNVSFVAPTPSNNTNVTSFYANISSADNNSEHYVATDLDRSLVLWLRMDDSNSTGHLTDRSTWSNNGTIGTGMALASNGLYNQSALFRGIQTDNITIPSSSSLDLKRGMTIAFWINYTAGTNQFARIFSRRESSVEPQTYYQINFNDAGGTTRVTFTANLSGEGVVGITNTNMRISQDSWNHVVFVYNDSGDVEAYINGTSVSVSPTTVNAEGFAHLVIGARATGGVASLNGSMDEVLIFNRSLSAQEAFALYNSSANKYARNFTNLGDGLHTIVAHAVDKGGNLNSTSHLTFRTDRTVPLISYAGGTAVENANVSVDYIYVNVSWTETNFGNITFTLMNSSGLANSTTFTTPRYDMNWTGLSAGLYTYNVSIRDTFNNFNSTENRTITLTQAANSAPQIIGVRASSTVDPIESGLATTIINFSVVDSDGASDLNLIGALNISYSDTVRQNMSCSQIEASGVSANYSCAVRLWYFDAPGTWNITASINDTANGWVTNTTATFQYNQLQAIVISPSQVSFSVAIGAVNQTATNAPTLINNTGNYNVTAGNVQVEGIHLYGALFPSYFLNISNFTADIDTGSLAECTGGTSLVNGTSVGITGALLLRGNNSVGAGDTTSGQEQLYYCIREVPSNIPSQVYSTSSGGAWVIRIAVLAILPRLRRRKKEKKSSLLDGLSRKDARALKRIVQLDVTFEKKYHAGLSAFVEELKKEQAGDSKTNVRVPLSIFTSEIGAAESLCKYLRDTKKMRFNEISRLINRDQRTVWTSYTQASEKKETLPVEEGISLPVTIFSDRRFSILESVVYYLRERGFTNAEVARLLGKDPRNTYTLYSRRVKKIRGLTP